MSNTVEIHTDKTPVRIHFIAEWADRRRMKQKDIVREIGADKGLVSRWFNGTLPKPEYLEALRQLFELEDINALFRHPDDDWMARLFRERSEKDRRDAIEILNIFTSLSEDHRVTAKRLLQALPARKSS